MYKQGTRAPEPEHIGNFSALCREQRCVQPVLGLSNLRFFTLLRKAERSLSSNASYFAGNLFRKRKGFAQSTYLKMTDHASQNVNSLPEQMHGFIAFPSNLALTPQTLVKAPRGGNEVATLLKFGESQINIPQKPQKLMGFRDHAVSSRSELILWYANGGIKLKCIGKSLKEKWPLKKERWQCKELVQVFKRGATTIIQLIVFACSKLLKWKRRAFLDWKRI